jgi:hypothetical protein
MVPRGSSRFRRLGKNLLLCIALCSLVEVCNSRMVAGCEAGRIRNVDCASWLQVSG